jgi:hypothetical protein
MLDQGELLIAGAPKEVPSCYHKMIFGSQERIYDLKNVGKIRIDIILHGMKPKMRKTSVRLTMQSRI